MMEGLDDGPDFLSEEDRGVRNLNLGGRPDGSVIKHLPSAQVMIPGSWDRAPHRAPCSLKAINVDLQSDAALQVDISDALSERDKVKFTVHTKIPPAPPRPDFDASREKLQKLGEGEGSMTKEEFTKMKQELEAEYLAIFKKTVAMHEVFLCRVAAHPILRKDLNFHVFLEYNQDLSVRGKNKKEKLEDFFKNMVKSADGVIVSGVKDVDDFFEHERTFLLEYHNRVKDASAKSDRMTRSHKSAADDYNRIGSSLYALGTQDSTDICKFFLKVSELFDKTRKIEARVSADEDLKLSDLLKYYLRESQAAKDLLYRRSRSLVDYENANKALDKARAKNKDVLQAETSQQLCCQKFEKISESAKQELIDFKTRRVAAFRKNLVELAELELKHAKGNLQLLQNCLAVFNGDT
ncbi:sorting nexin-6 isoform X2 [Mirounga leonina]|uniref:sorting nexin-6 isoform X2 n=1 Tax=Mirounga leonina TaxID=9715 RepID=UPI00156C3E0E|nr:sorting nexin-6 isoform X2 [Mirounga leonina]